MNSVSAKYMIVAIGRTPRRKKDGEKGNQVPQEGERGWVIPL
jgi:hypothetical protein